VEVGLNAQNRSVKFGRTQPTRPPACAARIAIKAITNDNSINVEADYLTWFENFFHNFAHFISATSKELAQTLGFLLFARATSIHSRFPSENGEIS